jgi:hypothetical protein
LGIYQFEESYAWIGVGAVVGIVCGLLIEYKINKQIVFLFFGILTYVICASLGVKAPLLFYNFTPLFPGILLLFACMIDLGLTNTRTSARIGVLICGLVLGYALIENFSETGRVRNNYSSVSKTAEYIYTYAKTNLKESNRKFFVTAGRPNSNWYWEQFPIWYAIEVLHGPFVMVASTNGNVIPLDQGKLPFFLVCEEYGEKSKHDCYDNFLAAHPEYSFDRRLYGPIEEYEISLFYSRQSP